MTQPQNPIEERFDQLDEQWNEFAENKNARVLRWLYKSDELDILRAYFEGQKNDVFDAPDHWIWLQCGCSTPAEYSAALCNEFLDYFKALKSELEQEGGTTDWKPPVPAQPDQSSALLSLCTSFQTHYKDTMDKLVCVLDPATIANPEGFSQWLRALLALQAPDSVRFVVLDSQDTPAYDTVAQQYGQLVVSTPAELNMDDAFMALAASDNDTGPGSTLRMLMVALNQAAGKGDVKAFEKNGAEAKALCEKERWYSLGGIAAISMAAGYLVAGAPDKAIGEYRNAGSYGEKAIGNKETTGAKLQIQALFGEAGVAFGQKKYQDASQTYQNAAQCAKANGEKSSVIDGLRMAGFSHEMAKQYSPAWKMYREAMSEGETIEEKDRPNTTLAYVGESLVRLCTIDYFDLNKSQINSRMAKLLGEGWQTQVQKGGQS